MFPYQTQVNPGITTQTAQANPLPQSTAIGDSLAKIGANVEDYASALNVEQKQQSQLYASTAVANLKVNSLQDLSDASENMTGNGGGFTDAQVKNYQAKVKSILDNTTDNYTKGLITQQTNAFLPQIQRQALSYERKQGIQYAYGNIDQMIQSSGYLAASDPQQYNSIVQQNIDAINNSVLPQKYKDQQIQKAKTSTALAIVDNYKLNDPGKLADIGSVVFGHPTFNPQSVGDDPTKQEIVNTAKKYGVNPALALATASIESNFGQDPNAKSIGEVKNGSGSTDQSVQINEMVQRLAENKVEITKQIGHAPSAEGERLAYHFGVKGAGQILNADSNAPIESIIGEQTAVSNNIAGLTVGQVIKKENTTLRSKMAPFGTIESPDNLEPWVKNIPVEKWYEIYNHAQTTLGQQDMQNAALFKERVKNDSPLMRNGIITNPTYTLEDFRRYYKNDAVAQVENNNYIAEMTKQKTLNLMDGKSVQERQAIVAGYRADPSSPSYAIDQKNHDAVEQANNEINKALVTDPAKYADTNQYVQQLKANAYDSQGNAIPQRLKPYLDASKAYQQSMGAPAFKPLDKNTETATVIGLKQMKPEQLVDYFGGLANKYGDYTNDVMKQLASNPNFPAELQVMNTLPTRAEQLRLAQLAQVNTKDLEADLQKNSSLKQLNNDVAKAITPLSNSVQINAKNQQTLSAYETLIKKAVMVDMLRGGNTAAYSQSLAQKEVDALINKQYTFKNNDASNYTLRIPNQYNPDLVANGTSSIVQNIASNPDIQPPVDILAKQFGMDTLNFNYRGKYDRTNITPQEYFAQQLKSNSVWITNSDDSGANLYILGRDNVPYPVQTKTGEDVFYKFEDLEVAGKNPINYTENLGKFYRSNALPGGL